MKKRERERPQKALLKSSDERLLDETKTGEEPHPVEAKLVKFLDNESEKDERNYSARYGNSLLR